MTGARKPIASRFFPLYAAFCAACAAAALVFCKRRSALFLIWYAATALAWIVFAVSAAALLAVRFKSAKIKEEVRRAEERNFDLKDGSVPKQEV